MKLLRNGRAFVDAISRTSGKIESSGASWQIMLHLGPACMALGYTDMDRAMLDWGLILEEFGAESEAPPEAPAGAPADLFG